EDHGGVAGAAVVADLVPGVGGPVLGTAPLDHVDPHLVEFLALLRVHGRRELATLHHEVLLAVVGVGREEAGVDGGPAAAAADADAVVAFARRADLGGLLDQVGEVLGWLDAELAEDALVVGHVVELEAPRNCPLLGAGAPELGPALPSQASDLRRPSGTSFPL